MFYYDGKAWCDSNGKMVSIDDYGISVSGTPIIGDKIIVNETTTPIVFDIIGIDHETPSDTNYTHSMTLQMHDLYNYLFMFDSPNEAAWYIDSSSFPNGLKAGTYYFTLSSEYDNYVYGSGSFNFTLTKDVPVGGQVQFIWPYNKYLIDNKLSTFSSVANPTAIETVSISQGIAGTKMPDIKPTVASNSTNCLNRIRYGSNNWAESSLRQWLNTDKNGGEWWEPKTVFDRIPNEINMDGFLKGLDPAFVNIIGEVTKKTQANVTDNYDIVTSSERFFIPSLPEVYGGIEREDKGADGTVYDYYGPKFSDLTSPGMATDSNRIKYADKYPGHWWLRTTFPIGGHTLRYVTDTGSIKELGGKAYVAPICAIV